MTNNISTHRSNIIRHLSRASRRRDAIIVYKSLRLADLVGDGSGADAWMDRLTCNVRGGIASPNEEAICTFGDYLDWLNERLIRDDVLSGVVREIECYNPGEVVPYWRREPNSVARKVIERRARWPGNLAPYRTFREVSYFTGLDDYPEPPWHAQFSRPTLKRSSIADLKFKNPRRLPRRQG